MKIKTFLSKLNRIDEYYENCKLNNISMPAGKAGMRFRAISSFVIYGTSFSEYFGYRFWEKTRKVKKTYMTRRYMFSFFDKYNPSQCRSRIGDKAESFLYYKKYLQREHFSYEDGFSAFCKYCSKYPRIFVKRKVGWGGTDAYIADVDTPQKQLETWAELSNDFLVEPYLENCPQLSKIYPYSLNTIKVTVLLVHGKPVIQYALFRMGNGGNVDNVHSGGMAAGVNIETGVVETAAFDKHWKSYYAHPLTGETITGITIPMWNEVRELVYSASCVTPELRYSSWDIAVTKNGPVMMEGNWDAEFYAEQMIYNTGVKALYINQLESR